MSTNKSPLHPTSHVFGQDQKKSGEIRTLIVIGLTLVTMVAEIAGGIIYGSMALLADGLHMGSHAAALFITFFAYIYARRRAADPRFSFGVGKVNSLAGYTSALLLLGFALLMAWESFHRFLNPVEINFDMALWVAVVGLVVNAVCALILKDDHAHHGHDHDHGHSHDAHDPHHHHAHEDQNLRAAYLHVLADALTSVAAIIALLAGKFFGANWLDPVMGIVGAILIIRWSFGLLKSTSGILLDHQMDESEIRAAIEARREDKISDIHVWTIGPGVLAAELIICSTSPLSPADYKAKLHDIDHLVIEVHDMTKDNCPT